jgi:hypothetical protein
LSHGEIVKKMPPIRIEFRAHTKNIRSAGGTHDLAVPRKGT